MKAPLLIIAVLAITGCTGIKKSADGEINYRNGLFNKTFSELQYTEERTTNGVAKISVKIKGYESDGTKLVEATARGVAAGLKP